MRQFRHGDVLAIEVPEIPEGAERQSHNILAHGEATGHAHRLSEEGELYMKDGNLYFKAATGAHVMHEEHKRIDFPAGNYKVVIQREYVAPALARNVLD